MDKSIENWMKDWMYIYKKTLDCASSLGDYSSITISYPFDIFPDKISIRKKK